MDTLLQHNINRFGAVTVADVLLYEPGTNVPILYLDTLKITSIAQEGQQKEIRGGQGAPLLIVYDYARTVSLEIQDALASVSSLSVLWGADLKADGGKVEYQSVFSAFAADGKTITVPDGIKLGDTAATEARVIDYKAGIEYEVTAATGSTLTIETAPKDSELKVFLPATAVASAKTGVAELAIKSTSMPPTVRMVGKTFFVDQATGKQIPAEIEIPLLKINIGGGITLESEGDASVFDFSGQALADPISKNFFTIKYLK